MVKIKGKGSISERQITGNFDEAEDEAKASIMHCV
jgi:hypothetical protein